MPNIQHQFELIEAVELIKLKALMKFSPGEKLKIGPLMIGSKNPGEVSYSWLHYHESIDYDGEKINVKVLTGIGMLATKIRQYQERKFNDRFILPETVGDAFEREAKTAEKLFNGGFPTPQPMQHLLHDMHGNIKVPGVLLTKKIGDPTHTIDVMLNGLFRKDPNIVLACIADGAKILKSLHEDYETIWGDPSLVNTFYVRGKQYFHNFAFAPNTVKPFDFLKARDLIGFTISAVYRARLPREVRKTIKERDIGRFLYGLEIEEVVDTVMQSYNPSKKLREELRSAIESIKSKGMDGYLKNTFYYQPVYGMTRDEGLENTLVRLAKHL